MIPGLTLVSLFGFFLYSLSIFFLTVPMLWNTTSAGWVFFIFGIVIGLISFWFNIFYPILAFIFLIFVFISAIILIIGLFKNNIFGIRNRCSNIFGNIDLGVDCDECCETKQCDDDDCGCEYEKCKKQKDRCKNKQLRKSDDDKHCKDCNEKFSGHRGKDCGCNKKGNNLRVRTFKRNTTRGVSLQKKKDTKPLGPSVSRLSSKPKQEVKRISILKKEEPKQKILKPTLKEKEVELNYHDDDDDDDDYNDSDTTSQVSESSIDAVTDVMMEDTRKGDIKNHRIFDQGNNSQNDDDLIDF